MDIPRGRILTFADDVLLYTQGPHRQKVAETMNSTLREVADWCCETGSVVNAAKASTMWCSLDNKIVNKSVPDVSLGGEVVERVSKFKYLGITFDRTRAKRSMLPYRESVQQRSHGDEGDGRCEDGAATAGTALQSLGNLSSGLRPWADHSQHHSAAKARKNPE